MAIFPKYINVHVCRSWKGEYSKPGIYLLVHWVKEILTIRFPREDMIHEPGDEVQAY